MTLLSNASKNTDQADLVILSHVETIRDQMQPASASAVASLIGGAPELAVLKRMHRLESLALLDFTVEPGSYQLTELGVEVLRRDLVGWTPSPREEARRNAALRQLRNFFDSGHGRR